MKKIIIINGPNLNFLGKREPEIYGSVSFEDFLKQLEEKYTQVSFDYFQSNHEGDIIDKLQEVGFEYDGIILNAGGFTHTSIAIRDTIAMIKTPVVEVHISNIHSRESFRVHSYITPKCIGIIAGLGLKGYDLGVQYFL